jgi:hypothetical protein
MRENRDLDFKLQGVKIKTNSLLKSKAARVFSTQQNWQTLANTSSRRMLTAHLKNTTTQISNYLKVQKV